MADDAFLSRWARRKAQAKSGAVPAEPPPPVSAPTLVPAGEDGLNSSLSPAGKAIEGEVPAQTLSAPPLPPPLTMDDVAMLTPASDYSRFVAPGVDAGVSNAAMKKLFTDPHFNVMDRLDIYIDDYSQPDPIPESMLRKMVQARFLGLFDDDEDEKKKLANAAATTTPAPDNPIRDEDTPVQLQPDDAAGRAGPDEGAGPRES
jgi:Protein of unknown function (DUF3306)